MKKALCSFAAALTAFTVFSDASVTNTSAISVTNVKVWQNRATQDVNVSYDLSNQGEPAIVLMDVLTNGVSIGTETFKTVEGAYSTGFTNLVSDGTGKSFVWHARQDWRRNFTSNAVVMVYAYYTNWLEEVPGVYMVIDLSGGSSATSYPVSYTFAAPAVNDENRTTKLWLKRIESGPFLMGSTDATDPFGRTAAVEIQHEVKLSNAFFAGVFEVTQRQYELVTGKTPSVSGSTNVCPVNYVSYDDIRGTNLGTNWPVSSEVDSGTFIKLLRDKTGIHEFDLPTDAQWEYACRAGTTGAWNNGTTITNIEFDANLEQLGWVSHNAASSVKPVGTKVPNAWGLYDMHGNVSEWCLDWFCAAPGSLPDGNLDPRGPNPVSGGSHLFRGGACNGPAKDCRSAVRASRNPPLKAYSYGFRIFRTLP